MVRTVLPTIPAIILGVIEPLLLLSATIQITMDPAWFFILQAPSYPLPVSAVPPQGVGAAQQLGNIFLMLTFFAILCVWTPHPEIARYYCLIVALADWGHIYSFHRAVGGDYFWNFAGWHRHMWENVGVSVFLNVVRLATVAGVFGKIGGSDKGKAKRT
ncbi:hypothetical protein GE09DRAFT_1089231 [Coniochaeta sp. 2T2.1]|nr:hypothetical protein GE09DRAFT_1089231 [Coniochaeta sp. 2T2.1]